MLGARYRQTQKSFNLETSGEMLLRATMRPDSLQRLRVHRTTYGPAYSNRLVAVHIAWSINTRTIPT
jgi:hypothetical protein